MGIFGKKQKKFTLYVGLFDKDTKKQEITTTEALNKVNKILLQYVDGATAYEGSGIYKHINGSIVLEPNIIIILYYTNKKTVAKIIKELKRELNQESIGREQTNVCIDFV